MHFRDVCEHLLNGFSQVASDNEVLNVLLNIQEIQDHKVRFVVSTDKCNTIDKTICKDEAIFYFFVLIEQIVAEQLSKEDSKLIFHGGSFSLNNNAVLVIQGKGAGKTTLIAKMTSFSDFKYLADDVAICCSKSLSILPLPLPLRLRMKDLEGFNLKGKFLGECKDFQGKTRFLFLPESWSLAKAKLRFILIPEYTHNAMNSFCCTQIAGMDRINGLKRNIREVSSVYSIYKGFINISNSTKMYKCSYSGNIEWIAEQIGGCIRSCN